MKFPLVKITNNWAYISTKNIKQRSISTVYPILCITDSSLWRSFVRIGSENKAAENPTSSEKVNSNCPTASPLGQRSRKLQ